MKELRIGKRGFGIGFLCLLFLALMLWGAPKRAYAAEASGDAARQDVLVQEEVSTSGQTAGTQDNGSSIKQAAVMEESTSTGSQAAAEVTTSTDGQSVTEGSSATDGQAVTEGSSNTGSQAADGTTESGQAFAGEDGSSSGQDVGGQDNAGTSSNENGTDTANQDAATSGSGSQDGSTTTSDGTDASTTNQDGTQDSSSQTDSRSYVAIWHGIDLSPVYDGNYYINLYPDLKAAFGSDDAALLNHFATFGLSEGRSAKADYDKDEYAAFQAGIEPIWAKIKADSSAQSAVWNGTDYSPVYDYIYYAYYDRDVSSAMGYGPQGMLQHFVTFGMKEQRQGNASFDEKSYRRSYQDLRTAFRNDYSKYYLHYINNGMKEGRTGILGVKTLQNPVTSLDGQDYSPVYDYFYYTKTYSDIANAFGEDDVAALQHFVTFGMKEQRRGNSTFDERSYRRANQDLRTAFRNNYAKYYLHYINSGRKEGRKGALGVATLENPVTTVNGLDLSSVYDYFYYINKYADLKKAFGEDDIATIEHFATFGMKEGRQGKESFSQSDYDTLEPVASHVVNAVTSLNGVDYSPVYSYAYYAVHNKDVAVAMNYDPASVLQHFVTFGMKEQRQGSANFDEKSYRRAYQDLRKAFGSGYVKYYLHYINSGRKEGRSLTTGITTIQNPVTSYHGVDLSAAYDYSYYMDNNSDLKSLYGDDDISAIQHFVLFGAKEGRSSKENPDSAVYEKAAQIGSRSTSATDTYHGVSLSPVYDYFYYLWNNSDLVTAFQYDGAKTIEHFVLSGVREGRKAKADYNASDYSRLASISANMPGTTSYDGMDYSSIYDYFYYTWNSPQSASSCNYSPDRMLSYFANYGIKNGDRAKAQYDATVYASRRAYAYIKDISDGTLRAMAYKAMGYSSATSNLILVNRAAHLVAIFRGSQNAWQLINNFSCTVGKPSTPTVTGTFSTGIKEYYFDSGIYRCFYATQIYGDYLFHSVLYAKTSTPQTVLDGTMGASASHGCIRLAIQNAKYIYDYIPHGTRVVIYN